MAAASRSTSSPGKTAKKVAKKTVAKKAAKTTDKAVPGKTARKTAKKVTKKPGSKVGKKAASKKVVSRKATGRDSVESRHEMIAKAAYYRSEQRNFQDGDALADWLTCEAEIDAVLTEAAQ